MFAVTFAHVYEPYIFTPDPLSGISIPKYAIYDTEQKAEAVCTMLNLLSEKELFEVVSWNKGKPAPFGYHYILRHEAAPKHTVKFKFIDDALAFFKEYGEEYTLSLEKDA